MLELNASDRSLMKTICVLPRSVRTGRFLLELLAGAGGIGRSDDGGFGMGENSHYPNKTVMEIKILNQNQFT